MSDFVAGEDVVDLESVILVLAVSKLEEVRESKDRMNKRDGNLK